jgi:hypothetical protein
MGMRLKYPTDWAEPQFTSGQMMLTKSLDSVGKQPLTQPVVSLNLVNTRALKIAKDATLQDIVLRVSSGPDVTVRDAQDVKIAGLDAAYLALTDTHLDVNGYALAFRLPDGRVGSFIAIAPTSLWAYVVPAFEQMRITAALIKPADYLASQGGTSGASTSALTTSASFPPGGVTFSLPAGWTGINQAPARLYFEGAHPPYVDQSGFSNGPHLTIIAQRINAGTKIRDAIPSIVQGLPGDTIADVNIGGQTGVEIDSFDPVTSQAIVFVAFPSQDGSVMIIFRWTVPGMLTDTLRPTLDAIVQSIRLGPISR